MQIIIGNANFSAGKITQKWISFLGGNIGNFDTPPLPREERDWDAGALMLLQLSGNKIMYRNISVNPIGKAEFIEGKLQQYLDFRLAELTHEQVKEMEHSVDEIVQSHTEFKSDDNEAKSFKAGKRADHDSLPDEIKALYVENLDLVHRMRELHLKLRTMSISDSACADSDRYPFLKEFIKLDKKLHDNWNVYDHFVVSSKLSGLSGLSENATQKKCRSYRKCQEKG